MPINTQRNFRNFRHYLKPWQQTNNGKQISKTRDCNEIFLNLYTYSQFPS